MEKIIHLVPGNSVKGDSNIRHPHGDILNIKGFYEQDSHVMPENLIEVTKVLVDEVEDHWCEYIPESYDGSKPVPLVLSRHGGGQSGWGQCYATSWTTISDREGFIAVFPNAGMHRTGGGPRDMGSIDKESHDLKFMLSLIKDLKSRYNIDAKRIFMQGMSMGDLMTMQMSRAYGHILAGAGNAAGPSPIEGLINEDGSLKEYDCHVPVFQSRGEKDDMAISKGYDGKATRHDINLCNRDFWLEINECSTLPEIKIEGENNFLFYKGEKADLIYRDVKRRGHGQTFDDAEYVWSMFFSGLSREADGTITKTETRLPAKGDKNAVAIAKDCAFAYIDNKKVAISENGITVVSVTDELKLPEEMPEEIKKQLGLTGPIIFGPYMYVPVTFLTQAFDADVKIYNDGLNAEVITKAEDVVRFSKGNVGCTVNNFVHSMDCPAEYFNNTIYIPIKWFAQNILNLFVTEMDDVMYISDHFGELTKDVAGIIKDILKLKIRLSV